MVLPDVTGYTGSWATMLFNSIEFPIFFVVVYGLYLGLQHRAQNFLLLVASYFFYGFWDYRFLSLIFISTVIDYFAGLAIHRSESPRKRNLLLGLSLLSNLGILGTFKYLGFFMSSLQAALTSLGLSVDVWVLQIVLPVGISFYTFQTLSYTFDVYRKRLKPTEDFLNFALFVSFFPQLVAGPIERARDLLPQVERPRRIGYEHLREGAWLVLLGFYKKLVIADNMSPFTSRIFESPAEVHGLEILFGIYAFAFQIYGDFSGYSDIAKGTAKLLGFELMHNFRMPYFAVNPSDFWRRWHISLSSWLRDYLYIALGGNRGSRWNTYRNLMLTMVLGGLWHGAAWNFVAWGVFHGGILCIHRLWTEGRKPAEAASGWRHWCKVALFFQVTCIGWLLFVVKQLSDVPLLLRNLVSPFEINGLVVLASLLVFALPLVVLDWLQYRTNDLMLVKKAAKPTRLAVYALTASAIVLCGATGAREFIYFQF